MTTHVAVQPGFADLVDLWAPVRQIGTGFQFTEGPIWHPRRRLSAVLRHAGRCAPPLTIQPASGR